MSDKYTEALSFAKEQVSKLSYRLECALNIPCRSYYEKLELFYYTAISALTEMQNREQGCEHCNGYKDIVTDRYGNTVNLNQRHDGLGYYIEYDGSGESLEAYISYCPMCGRRLKDGAK